MDTLLAFGLTNAVVAALLGPLIPTSVPGRVGADALDGLRFGRALAALSPRSRFALAFAFVNEFGS